jgi:3-methyladenine DNA glycosylase AlkD
MIVTGAWWDYVDGIAAHRLGPLLQRHPAAMRRRMLAWSRCPDLWKRRASILCQLRFKEATDLELLYACIRPNLGDPEFFMRKAIGWALREYAWTDPGEIRRFVREHESELSPLSRREALKNIGAPGRRGEAGNVAAEERHGKTGKSAPQRRRAGPQPTRRSSQSAKSAATTKR